MKIIEQLKHRRLALGLKQTDMQMRIGMNQQQYQTIERRGNPRLNTLELIAEGLEAELMLIPKNQVRAVRQFLQNQGREPVQESAQNETSKKPTTAAAPEVAVDPWSGMLDE